jgi:quercetin dioxygenase-like cupin family protein
VNIMNRAEFEVDALRDGYEMREGEITPNQHREVHAHEFDARLFVLDGHLTLVRDGDRHTFSPGETCSVPAGTLHEEHTEADGVRYVAARRSVPRATAAE